MVHATHQLFLRESCLYVLVISARSEINATEQAEYWLEHVKSLVAVQPYSSSATGPTKPT